MSLNKMEMNMNLMEGQNKMAVAWIDLTFYGQSVFNRRKDPILNAINGFVDFGTITALMGPSGSGKTTLLKCINGRLKTFEDSKIYLSSGRDIKACFIVQEVSDHLMNGLTAFQAVVYASKLKNLNKECDNKSNARKLMSELMIGDIEKTLVENCSEGEQKRVVIAQELTAMDKPNLLCIDEPTSGLDSNAADIVR